MQYSLCVQNKCIFVFKSLILFAITQNFGTQNWRYIQVTYYHDRGTMAWLAQSGCNYAHSFSMTDSNDTLGVDGSQWKCQSWMCVADQNTRTSCHSLTTSSDIFFFHGIHAAALVNCQNCELH